MTDSHVRWIVGIFSLLIGAAGWFYMFYSRAAHKLAVVEQPHINRRRIAMRRVGGMAMIALAGTFYVGCDALFRRDLPLFAWMLFAILALMAVILVLDLLDLRLTRKLRNDNPDRHDD